MATGGFGTLLKRNGVEIADVTSINGPGFSLQTVEVTHLTSTAGWKEFIAATKEMKTLSFTINFLPADATHSVGAGLLADLIAGTLQLFSIRLTDAALTTWSWYAFVTDFDITGVSPEGALQANVTLRPSGQPTLA